MRLLDGRLEKVRYIGVNAPEVHHPTKGEEPGGREAAEVNRVAARALSVLAENRRHPDESQRSLARHYLLKRDPLPNCSPPRRRSSPARRLNVSTDSVQAARKVLERGAPELIRAVEQVGGPDRDAESRPEVKHRKFRHFALTQTEVDAIKRLGVGGRLSADFRRGRAFAAGHRLYMLSGEPPFSAEDAGRAGTPWPRA